MKYLLDTNHWSYIQRQQPTVMGRLRLLPMGSEFCMSAVSQEELLAGVEVLPEGKRKSELRELYRRVVDSSAMIIAADAAVAECYGSLFAELRRAGRPTVTNDIWIAATAIVHDLVLASNDAHFGSIRGLRTEN